MSGFEYRVEWGDVAHGLNRGQEAAQAWMGLLNKLGHDRWELVTEHRLAGGSALDESSPVWIRYGGTFKRRVD